MSRSQNIDACDLYQCQFSGRPHFLNGPGRYALPRKLLALISQIARTLFSEQLCYGHWYGMIVLASLMVSCYSEAQRLPLRHVALTVRSSSTNSYSRAGVAGKTKQKKYDTTTQLYPPRLLLVQHTAGHCCVPWIRLCRRLAWSLEAADDCIDDCIVWCNSSIIWLGKGKCWSVVCVIAT